MIRTAAMMIGGLLLLLVACPLHALAKSGTAAVDLGGEKSVPCRR